MGGIMQFDLQCVNTC